MFKHLRGFLFLSFLLFCCLLGNSQNINIPSFVLKTNFKTIPDQNFKDTIGKFSSNEFEIGFSFPLFTKLFVNKLNKSGFYNISIDNNNTLIFNSIDFLKKSNTLYNINFGLKGIYFTGNKNLWIAKISSNLFEDEYSISDPTPRFSGLLLFDRLVNKKFSYHLGIAYRYSFGTTSVLPVAGLKYEFANSWKLNLSLPFSGSVQYKASDKLFFLIKLRASGAISYYTNNDNLFGLTQEKLMYRKKSNTLSIEAIYKLNSFTFIKGSIGREGSRKIYFSDLKTEINKEPVNYFSSKINNAWFIDFGINFRISKNKKNPINEDEILDFSDELVGVN